MKLKEAREFRDYIIAKVGVNCTVPLGFGPDGYFPRSILSTGPHDWKSRAEFRKWAADHLRKRRRIMHDYNEMMARKNRRARSPIELMIDRACGLA